MEEVKKTRVSFWHQQGTKRAMFAIDCWATVDLHRRPTVVFPKAFAGHYDGVESFVSIDTKAEAGKACEGYVVGGSVEVPSMDLMLERFAESERSKMVAALKRDGPSTVMSHYLTVENLLKSCGSQRLIRFILMNQHPQVGPYSIGSASFESMASMITMPFADIQIASWRAWLLETYTGKNPSRVVAYALKRNYRAFITYVRQELYEPIAVSQQEAC